jgi:hypothetical protein
VPCLVRPPPFTTPQSPRHQSPRLSHHTDKEYENFRIFLIWGYLVLIEIDCYCSTVVVSDVLLLIQRRFLLLIQILGFVVALNLILN